MCKLFGYIMCEKHTDGNGSWFLIILMHYHAWERERERERGGGHVSRRVGNWVQGKMMKE